MIKFITISPVTASSLAFGKKITITKNPTVQAPTPYIRDSKIDPMQPTLGF